MRSSGIMGSKEGLDKELELTPKERNLITLLRNTRYGQVVIFLEEGQPVRIEEIKKSVKL